MKKVITKSINSANFNLCRFIATAIWKI